ncbi:MAG: hypothetical protein LBC40_03860 [Dysgonamonadaceae bacterium]|jgi:metal-responsive CopG/Arc/MetJ family transcriptional regulator|nr:hypothetical protein [Dysgonamonadaceae bacterium]
MLSTVTVPFQDDLLQQIDKLVVNNVRSRVDIILDATRIYVERKLEWQDIFSAGELAASKNQLSEADILDEIKAYRHEK